MTKITVQYCNNKAPVDLAKHGKINYTVHALKNELFNARESNNSKHATAYNNNTFANTVVIYGVVL